MITYDTFKQLKELQSMGKSQVEIAKVMDISKRDLAFWWGKTTDEYYGLEKSKMHYLDNYRGFILDTLKLTPQIRAANLLGKVKDAFPDFQSSTPTFYRYLHKLREEQGLAQFAKRIHSTRQREPMGEEAQVDFGQYKMKTRNGATVKVYFFCMVLSYSSMRFVHFEPDPFTTDTAVMAHEYAFQFFGGRTKTIMYDLDRLFVASESFGDMILTKGFEEYVRRTGFMVAFCKPRDPNTKGRVENLVGFIKYNFLEGKTYYGIDELNLAALRWLDTTGNGVSNDKKHFKPRDRFREERHALTPVAPIKYKRQIYEASKSGSVKYEGNFYEMPRGTHLRFPRVRVEESDGTLCFYQLEKPDLICKHEILEGKDNFAPYLNQETEQGVATNKMEELFAGDELFEKYMARVKETNSRYLNRQSMAIKKLAKVYSKEEMRMAFKHCIMVDKCKFAELAPFLIYRFGRAKARNVLTQVQLYNYTNRAEKIAEEYHGK